jgi:DNA polymerase III delta prime subunit
LSFKIITADERMATLGAPKVLIAGPPGVGKTSLLRTIDPEATLFWDLEAGDLAVRDVEVDQVRARTWRECRDLACFLGGPNPNIDPDAIYGVSHYDAVIAEYGDVTALDKYRTYFIDSITVAARLCLAWAQHQPEAFNTQGKPDMRGAYGLLGREMINWMTQLQHARSKNVVFVGILEQAKDEFGRSSWGLQVDGQKAIKEIPGVVDEVLAMMRIPFDGGEPVRTLLCSPEAQDHIPGAYPLKDRSGLLDTYEPPNLGALIEKLGGQQ